MNRRSKYIILLILVTSVVFFFTGAYQMFVFDGKAKGCSGDNFFEYRDVKSIEDILELNKIECSKYWNYFDYWKYTTFSSVVLFFGSGIYLIRKRKRKE